MRKIFSYLTCSVIEVPASEAELLVATGVASYQNDVIPGRDADNPPQPPYPGE